MRALERPCVGALLAGGRATRFGGRPKGLEEVGGRRIVDRAAAALAQVADTLLLVANAPDAPHWLPGVLCTPDRVANAGALGGVLTALEHAATISPDAGVLALAWDMPFAPPSLLGELRRLAERTGAPMVVPIGEHGVEPLCAYYAAVCRAPIAARVARGDLRAQEVAAEVGALVIPAGRVVDWGDPARLFLSVNTPADLERARRLASGDAA